MHVHVDTSVTTSRAGKLNYECFCSVKWEEQLVCLSVHLCKVWGGLGKG